MAVSLLLILLVVDRWGRRHQPVPPILCSARSVGQKRTDPTKPAGRRRGDPPLAPSPSSPLCLCVQPPLPSFAIFVPFVFKERAPRPRLGLCFGSASAACPSIARRSSGRGSSVGRGTATGRQVPRANPRHLPGMPTMNDRRMIPTKINNTPITIPVTTHPRKSAHWRRAGFTLRAPRHGTNANMTCS